MSDSIIRSLNSLVKTNDGFFKSEKQSKFINDIADRSGVVAHFSDVGNTYGNTWIKSYTVDSKGVLSVSIEYRKTNRVEMIFERGGVNKPAERVAKFARIAAEVDYGLIEYLRKQEKESLAKVADNLRIIGNMGPVIEAGQIDLIDKVIAGFKETGSFDVIDNSDQIEKIERGL